MSSAGLIVEPVPAINHTRMIIRLHLNVKRRSPAASIGYTAADLAPGRDRVFVRSPVNCSHSSSTGIHEECLSGLKLCLHVQTRARMMGAAIGPEARMLLDWLYVAVFAVVGIIMAALPLAVVWLLAPRADYPQKHLTYESGVVPFGQAWVQFNIRYYLFALIFVLFEVEVIYLFPWAVVFREFINRQLGGFVFVEALLFIVILGMGLIYAWRKGALEWV